MRNSLLPHLLFVSLGVISLAGSAAVASAQTPPETIEYYATDALGSVRVVFTTTGEVIGRSEYLPFGDTLNQSGALPRQRFTGQEHDAEAGLDYFNARSLQMRTGRMNRPDPLFVGAVGNPQAWNRYTYVQNRALVLTDASGLCGECVVFRSGVTVTLPKPSKPEFPPEELSEAAMEGTLDLLNGGGKAWYESLTGTSFAFFGSHVGNTQNPPLPPRDKPREERPQPCQPGPDYWDRYLQHVAAYTIDVGPYAAALLGGLWPKSWVPATGGRPALLGSDNPLTSVPRALSIPGAGSMVVRFGAAGVGVATVAVGWYNVGVFASGLVYAAPSNSNCGGGR